MDSLAALKPINTKNTAEEEQVIEEFFERPSEGSSGGTWGKSFKIALFLTFLFLVLSNSFTDMIMGYIPGVGGNVIATTAIKCVLFLIIAVLLVRYE